MNCDWVQQNISLYLYNELADDARHELEQHLHRCNNCAAELASQQEFQAQMNALPVEAMSGLAFRCPRPKYFSKTRYPRRTTSSPPLRVQRDVNSNA